MYDRTCLSSVQVGALEVRVYPDDNPESPRAFDNTAVMVCWHSRYNLGDRLERPFGLSARSGPGWEGVGKTPEEFEEWWQKNHEHKKTSFRLPLRLLDHSGLSMSIGKGAHPQDPGGWDSGQVGWIYSTRATRRETHTPDSVAVKAMEAEVEAYDKYLRGETSGYVVVRKCKCNECTDEHEVVLDSCWGFEDAETAEREGVDAAKNYVEKK